MSKFVIIVSLCIVVISSVVLITYKEPIQSYIDAYLNNKVEENVNGETNIAYNIDKEILSDKIDISTNVKTGAEQKKHYVKTSITISTTNKKLLKRINLSKSYLLDIYTTFFNNISHEELVAMSMDELKVKLQEEIDSKLQISTNGIYITEYLVQ